MHSRMSISFRVKAGNGLTMPTWSAPAADVAVAYPYQ
jgi:hypothetical protein